RHTPLAMLRTASFSVGPTGAHSSINAECSSSNSLGSSPGRIAVLANTPCFTACKGILPRSDVERSSTRTRITPNFRRLQREHGTATTEVLSCTPTPTAPAKAADLKAVGASACGYNSASVHPMLECPALASRACETAAAGGLVTVLS